VVTEHPVTTLSLTKPRSPDASVDHIVRLRTGLSMSVNPKSKSSQTTFHVVRTALGRYILFPTVFYLGSFSLGYCQQELVEGLGVYGHDTSVSSSGQIIETLVDFSEEPDSGFSAGRSTVVPAFSGEQQHRNDSSDDCVCGCNGFIQWLTFWLVFLMFLFMPARRPE